MSIGTLSAPVRRQAKRKLTMTARQVSRLGTAITVGLGCGIPLLSLSLSHLGGCLLASGPAVLGLMALALCVTVLGVSLSHLAWAISNITRSSRVASLSLAVAVDCTLVLAELVGVWGAAAEIEKLRVGLMVSVTGASMVLNVYAFCRNR